MADILFEHVSREYDEQEGLFDFSCAVEQGKAYALLGPTGSGKSTAIHLLAGLCRPDEGRVTIKGLDPFTMPHRLMQDVGLVPGDARLPRKTSGDAFIRLMAKARGDISRKRVQELLERLDVNPLGDWAYMMPDQRRKVVLVLALLHDPKILLLDEPCRGLDPHARNAVLDLLDEERKQGKTIFMTTHVFEEAQRCCDTIGIIRQGRLVTTQTAEALTYTRQKVYHITFEDLSQAAAFAQEWETGVELLRNRVIVAVPASPQVLLQTLAKYTVLDLVGGRETMEESFLRAFGGDLL